MAINLDKDYSKAYERLAGNGSEIVGLIAYAIYKEKKRERTIEIIKRTGKKPSRKDLEEFEQNFLDETHYKRLANERLDELFSIMIAKNRERLFMTYFKEEYENLKKLEEIHAYILKENEDHMKALRSNTEPRSFWGEMLIEVSGNFFWILVLFSLSFIAIATSDQVKQYKDNISNFLEGKYNIDPKDSVKVDAIKPVTQKKSSD